MLHAGVRAVFGWWSGGDVIEGCRGKCSGLTELESDSFLFVEDDDVIVGDGEDFYGEVGDGDVVVGCCKEFFTGATVEEPCVSVLAAEDGADELQRLSGGEFGFWGFGWFGRCGFRGGLWKFGGCWLGVVLGDVLSCDGCWSGWIRRRWLWEVEERGVLEECSE